MPSELPTLEESLTKLVPELAALLVIARRHLLMCKTNRQDDIKIQEQRSFNTRIYNLKDF